MIFLLSMLSLYVTYAEALCLKTCKAELTKRAAERNAPAADVNNFISIVRTQTCMRDTNCATNRYLVENFDTSDQNISGKFIEKNNDLARQKPKMKQSYTFYGTAIAKTTNSTIILVDPDGETMVRSKIISIEPSLKDFTLEKEMKKTELSFNQDIRIVRHQAWVNEECTRAVIGWKNNGTFNLPIVLKYMISGCQGDLPIVNSTEKIITKKEPRNFCGQECQHKKYMEKAKKDSKALLLKGNLKIKSSNMTVGGIFN